MYDPFKALCGKIKKIQDKYDDPEQRGSAKQEAIVLWKNMNPGKNRPPKDTGSHFGEMMSKLDDDAAIVASMLTPEQCSTHGIFN